MKSYKDFYGKDLTKDVVDGMSHVTLDSKRNVVTIDWIKLLTTE